jgi:hypothetical protein
VTKVEFLMKKYANGENASVVLLGICGYPGMISWMQARAAGNAHPVQAFSEGIVMSIWAEQLDDNVPMMVMYCPVTFIVMVMSSSGTGAQLGAMRIAAVLTLKDPLAETFWLAR